VNIVVPILMQEHAAASPFATPNPGMIIWTWVVFILLFLMLRKFAWPAILNLAEEREQTIKGQLEDAEKMHAESKVALEEHKALLAGAKEEASALVAAAKATAEKERESLIAKARQEQEDILLRAKREIQAERERAVAELRAEAVDLSLAAASRLVDANLDGAANRKLVSDYLDSLGTR
jgi:F-type H+-transporting ATPase subunit b